MGQWPLLVSLGVVAFSLSFPGTVFALGGFGPWTATGLRGAIAAALAGTALLWARPPVPARHDWAGITVVALGCALGFPLLTTLTLQTTSASHSAVVIGALSMATAVISTLREPALVGVLVCGRHGRGGGRGIRPVAEQWGTRHRGSLSRGRPRDVCRGLRGGREIVLPHPRLAGDRMGGCSWPLP